MSPSQPLHVWSISHLLLETTRFWPPVRGSMRESKFAPITRDARPPKGISLGGIEEEVLLRALQKCNWNQSQAARYLALSRKTLIYRMHKYNLVGRKPYTSLPIGPLRQRSPSLPITALKVTL